MPLYPGGQTMCCRVLSQERGAGAQEFKPGDPASPLVAEIGLSGFGSYRPIADVCPFGQHV